MLALLGLGSVGCAATDDESDGTTAAEDVGVDDDSATAPTGSSTNPEADGPASEAMLEDLASLFPAPDNDPGMLVAFTASTLPSGYEISRASAESPNFMSIELSNLDQDAISVIWGEELRAFDSIAESADESESIQVGDQPARLFTFDTASGGGPAVLWQTDTEVPLLVIGTPNVATDAVLAVADGVTAISQDEFIALAEQLAIERLEREIQQDLEGG